jgi:hypothetical protein
MINITLVYRGPLMNGLPRNNQWVKSKGEKEKEKNQHQRMNTLYGQSFNTELILEAYRTL